MATTSPLLSLPFMALDRDRVDLALRNAVQTKDTHLNELASHLIIAGGKRLRPVLSIAAAQVGNELPVSDEVIQGSIACELVHLGSLYHDDVMDESLTRRGVDTVNARWGNLQAILAGDFMLAKASEVSAALGTEVVTLLAQTIGRLCEGQIEELRHTYDVARSIPSYLVSIEGKTASLFATAARIGALVAGHDRKIVDVLTSYGTAYGMVFQIVDDILDVIATDGELGKRAGHDMEEGVYTLPVLLTLSSDSTDAIELRDLLGKPFTSDERDKALKIVRSNSGIASAIETALEYVSIAETECNKMPPSSATTAMRLAPRILLESVIR
jgi:heptaprenyl diphosphate synthase